MTQLALKTLAISILKHYPFDYNLDEYWSEYVCEHGQDREFCRDCKVIETATDADKCGDKYRKLLKEIADDPKTSKYLRAKIWATINENEEE